MDSQPLAHVGYSALVTPTAATKRLTNRRGQGSNLRAEILAAAERLLVTSGSRGVVTLRAIAREAGIAAPSIYPHFPDRDAILDAVVTRTFVALAETARTAAEAAPDGLDRVEAISLAYLAFARRHPGSYRILFERSPANIASPPHPYPEGIAAFGLMISAIEGIPAEDSTANSDPMLDAQSLLVALHGIATLTPALTGFPWRDEAELVRNLIRKMVGPPLLGDRRAGRAAVLEEWAVSVDPAALQMADTSVLREIAELVDHRDDVDLDLVAAVRAARTAGTSWSEIAAMLGVSKRAAQRKYRTTAASRKQAAAPHRRCGSASSCSGA